jgi:aarF domain-containing kinase
MGLDSRLVAKDLINIFADMIFKYGFVHCDAHPGNIFVRTNKKNRNMHQIVLLDHGLYRSLSQ